MRRARGDLGRKQAIAQILDQGQAMLKVGCEHPRCAEAGASQDGADGDERAHHVLGQMRDSTVGLAVANGRSVGLARGVHQQHGFVGLPQAGIGPGRGIALQIAKAHRSRLRFLVEQAQGGAEALRLGTKLAQPAHHDAAATARLGIGEFDFVAILGQKRGDAVGPFGKYGAALKRVLEAKFQCLLGAAETVKIEMRHAQSRRGVGLLQGEGRARHLDIGIQKRPDQRAGKGGFAGAQLAFEHHEAAGPQAKRQ